MNEIEPFLTKFAREPRPSVSGTQDKDRRIQGTGHPVSAVTPRPTIHTLVYAETTDDR